MADTFERVRKLIIENFDTSADKVTESASFRDLDMDSLDDVELIMAAEDGFGISVPDDMLDSIVTVKDLVDFVDQAMAEAA